MGFSFSPLKTRGRLSSVSFLVRKYKSLIGISMTLSISSNPEFGTVVVSFTDQNNSDLASYYGFPDDLSWIGNFSISFFADPHDQNGAFESSRVGTGDIYNTPVPIPAAAWLLDTGLVGLLLIRRRMKK